MNAERRVSGRFVEWLFARAKGTALAEAFRKAGLNLDALESDYPAERLRPWLDLYADSVLPGAPRAEAHRRIGFELIEAKRREQPPTSLAQAMIALPEKFDRMGNFFDLEVHPSASGFVATIDDVASVHTFFLGMLEAVSSSTAEGKKVVWAPSGLSGARYEVRVPSRDSRAPSDPATASAGA